VTRYFDHIQTCAPVRTAADALAPAFGHVAFDFKDAPRAERKVEAPKKKEKAAATAAETPVAGTSKVAAPPTEAAAVPGEGKSQKKEKKEKKKDAAPADEAGGKKKGAAAPAKAAAADDGEPVPSMIDLRVGHIVDSKLLPGFAFKWLNWTRSHETS
jgi:aminoacyl tRNA synthase complex-interacting multifunctional protein 1